MIPTLLVAGLVVGRWSAISLGAVGWAALLLLAGTIGINDAPFAAALGATNVAVGVVAHRAVAALPRLLGPSSMLDSRPRPSLERGPRKKTTKKRSRRRYAKRRRVRTGAGRVATTIGGPAANAILTRVTF